MSRAAEALDLTQSALSRQLATLESHLGKPLFVRTGRGVQLTEVGIALQAQIADHYRSIDAAMEALQEREGVFEGTLRVASVHTLSYYFLGDLVSKFMVEHQRVNLSLMGRSSPEVLQLVESGKVDVGFLYDSAVASADVVIMPMFDDEMCLIVREDCTTGQSEDISRRTLRLVAFPAHYALRRMLHSSDLHVDVVAEAETIDAMLQLVSSGVGDCILPSRIPDRLLADYKLRKVGILAPLLRRRIVAITRSGRPASALVQRLLDDVLSALS